MSHVIVRHVKSLPISPGPHTCVHVAHTMKKKRAEGRKGTEKYCYIKFLLLNKTQDAQVPCQVKHQSLKHSMVNCRQS